MTATKNWAEALNISPEKLAEWVALAPEGTPVLPWCLKNDFISTDAYLSWASDTYGLPIVGHAYFDEVFDPHSFVTDRHSGAWSRWCFPIGQWEDTTFVACVEPPNQMPSGSFALILADPHILSRVWDNGDPLEKAAEANANEAPTGINLNATSSFQLNLDNVTLMDSEPASQRIANANTLPPLPGNVPVLPPPPSQKAASAKPSGPPKIEAPAPPADTGFDRDLQLGLTELQPNYNALMVLRREENSLKAFKWDPNLKQGDAINLTLPSFFRIVAKTQQAYHGYVVDSSLHRQFFESIGCEGLPACATAIPLLVKGKVWGVLAAFGDDSAQSPDCLQKCMALATKLSPHLKSTEQKQAA